MRKTLLQGGYYVPSHATDIRETFKRIKATQELVKDKPLVETADNIIRQTRQAWTLADFEDILGPR